MAGNSTAWDDEENSTGSDCEISIDGVVPLLLRIGIVSCFFLAGLIPHGFAQVYEKIFDFTEARDATFVNRGISPSAALVLGKDGNFYGATDARNEIQFGSLFRMTPDGVLTTLVEFDGNGPDKGRSPSALVQGNDGNFYGSTQSGGAGGFGTVFKMTPAGVLTTLVEFTGNGGTNKGGSPSVLVKGNDGNFYGSTRLGGAADAGTVFKVTPDGVLTTLVEFTGNGGANKGNDPVAALLQGNDGNFYGSTYLGGAADAGTVFKMTPDGVLTTLVEFTGDGETNKGSRPFAPLVQGNDGDFYGTTVEGGLFNRGTVFKLTPAGVLTTLVEFTGSGTSNRGSKPYAALVQGSDGNFYGTTQGGGANGYETVSNGFGTVFKMTPAGVLTTLVEFTGNGTSNKGHSPFASLVAGTDGNLYGTTTGGGAYGGSNGYGTIFKITQSGVLTTLVEFKGYLISDIGSFPDTLAKSSNGSIYGTTLSGGEYNSGTIFEMTPAGVLTTLTAFDSFGFSEDGGLSRATLLHGSDGNFYGTRQRDSSHEYGTLFRMTPSGVLTTLVEFTGNDGANKGRHPRSVLVQGNDGNIYGSTALGGSNNAGTVFRMTPAGVLTTLVEFTGIGGANKGAGPSALLLGSDGNFYGTTRSGGSTDAGTVFKMTPAGVLTTLVEFTGTEGANRGTAPSPLVQGTDGSFYGMTVAGGIFDGGTIFKMTSAGTLTTFVEFRGNELNRMGRLVLANDGNFYGTTFYGGANNLGTVFKMTPTGVLTTVKEFSLEVDGSYPVDLVSDSDGNLYGTTRGLVLAGIDGNIRPAGTIYRLILPGAPSVFANKVASRGSTSALLEAQINARGAGTTVWLEYGTDGVTFPNTVPMVVGLNGFQTKLIGTTLSNLSLGTKYFWRLRAVNSAGVNVTPVQNFTTLAQPLVTIGTSSDVKPTSARFNGTVNARNFDATVSFEWGTDGNTFPNIVAAVPSLVTGDGSVPVSASVAGLSKGTQYFFRLRAVNAGGIAVSGVGTLTTLIEPTAAVTGAFGLNTTSAKVFGSVNANRSVTDVIFEYGTDGVNFPNSVAADPAQVTGEMDVAVSATLTNLSQGTTYRYRIRATSAGGVGVSAAGTFDLGVLSGFNQVQPAVLDPRANAQGFIVVNLVPAGIGEAWRFVGEQQWRAPGVPVGGLETGDRKIEFRPVPGYLHPLREPLSIVSGQAAIVIEREYFPGGGAATGSLSVTLLPASLGASAQWRLLGEGDSAWRASGTILNGLAAGLYLVESRAVTGYATPRPLSVPVKTGEAKTATAIYSLADAPVGVQPEPVGFDAITSSEPNPYTFVGQLRSDSGAGTGFVVRRRVVATAAHVVFDEGTFSAVTGLQWLFQRERGTYEPVPQVPRGSYILTGYAAQRQADGTPGSSSAASQNLDVAAVWFYEQDAGRGGSGGYLASDSLDNEWLLSRRLKTIVGYPLDDILPANQDRMHATPPMNVAFTHANDRVYLTADITSRGGNSGGPVCVQYDDGRYYPAAVYLGGTTQTRVRAIDSRVIALFDLAEESSNTGENNSGNIGTGQLTTPLPDTPAGALTVKIEPPAARAAGAGWRIGVQDFLESGKQRPYLSAGSYQVTCRKINGFLTPSVQNVNVTAGNTTNITVTYTLLQPPVITGPAVKRLQRNKPVTFNLQADNEPTLFSVGGLAGTGLTLSNAANGQISGTPKETGTFQLTAVARNDTGAGPPFTITLIVADPGTLVVQADPTRGSVTVKPRAPGNIFPQGEKVTLAAKPSGPDFLFAGWQFSGLEEAPSSDKAPTTTFTMTGSVVATADFVPNPYLTRSGSYYGLVSSTSGALGSTFLTLAKSGAFSLKLTLSDGSGVTLNGFFDADGNFSGSASRKGLTPVAVTLHMNPDATEPAFAGSIVVDGNTYTVDTVRSAFSRTDPAPEAGKHTALLPSDSLQSDAAVYPQGYGYLLLSVSPTGSIKATGQLGDGTPFSTRGFVRADHSWALHAQPYGHRGLLSGLLSFTRHSAPEIDEISGTLNWSKPSGTRGVYPAGFSGTIGVSGSRYTSPVKGNAALEISGWKLLIGQGVLAAPLNGTATLSTTNRFTVTPSSVATLILNASTGLLSGSFKPDANAKAVRFSGSVLQRQRTGAGVFVLPERSGPVTLDAP